ncbi:MAG: amidohydrolase family protein [Desulfatibacillaceae bacterium]
MNEAWRILRQDPRLPGGIVDYHVHLFPERMFDAIWRAFVDHYDWRVIHQVYHDEAIRYLRGHGVSHIVYSNYAHRPGVAPGLNEWNLGIVDRYEDVYCFAAFHPDDPEAMAMARDVLQHPCVLGFKLQLLVQFISPDDERLFPLYELVMEHEKRILFHVGTGPIGNPHVGLSFFRNLLERYPEMPANVAHMGGLEYRGFFELLDEYPNLVFDTSFSFLEKTGLVCDVPRPELERHMDHIVYGSDFPNLILPREDEIEYLLGMDMSPEFYRRVFRDNGLALLEGGMPGL